MPNCPICAHYVKNKLKLCIITKNTFFHEKNKIISNRPLFINEKILGFDLEEVEKLILIGFKNSIEFSGYEYEFKNEMLVIGSRFREEKRYVLDRLINIFNTLKEIWKNRVHFRDLDVIFAPFFEYTAFEILVLKLITSRSGFIVYFIGDYPELNFQKRKSLFLKILLTFLQKISIFLADQHWFITQRLLQKYGNKKSILMRLSSVSESEINSPKELNRNVISLLFVGRFEQEKQPYIPLLVLKQLKKEIQNIELKMVGDGSLRKQLEKMKEKLSLENVIFTGWITERKKLLEIFRHSDFLLLPSLRGEGFAQVILEAFSQGTIVISTRCDGPEEMIENTKNGFLIEIGMTEEMVERICEKIKMIIKTPSLYEEMSKNCIEKIKEWTLERIMAEQREKILSLLNKNERS